MIQPKITQGEKSVNLNQFLSSLPIDQATDPVEKTLIENLMAARSAKSREVVQTIIEDAEQNLK